MELSPDESFMPDDEFFGLPPLPWADTSGNPPLVDAAEVIAQFDSNYAAAARRYQFPITLRGVVSAVDRVRNQEKTFRDLFVVAADDQTPLLPQRLHYMEQFGEGLSACSQRQRAGDHADTQSSQRPQADDAGIPVGARRA